MFVIKVHFLTLVLTTFVVSDNLVFSNLFQPFIHSVPSYLNNLRIPFPAALPVTLLPIRLLIFLGLPDVIAFASFEYLSILYKKLFNLTLSLLWIQPIFFAQFQILNYLLVLLDVGVLDFDFYFV